MDDKTLIECTRDLLDELENNRNPVGRSYTTEQRVTAIRDIAHDMALAEHPTQEAPSYSALDWKMLANREQMARGLPRVQNIPSVGRYTSDDYLARAVLAEANIFTKGGSVGESGAYGNASLRAEFGWMDQRPSAP